MFSIDNAKVFDAYGLIEPLFELAVNGIPSLRVGLREMRARNKHEENASSQNGKQKFDDSARHLFWSTDFLPLKSHVDSACGPRSGVIY